MIFSFWDKLEQDSNESRNKLFYFIKKQNNDNFGFIDSVFETSSFLVFHIFCDRHVSLSTYFIWKSKKRARKIQNWLVAK